MITRDLAMYRVVTDHPQLLPLFPRFSLKLGFGELSVTEVCEAHKVNTDFFLEIANAYLDERYVPGEELSPFSLSTVVNYIASTHRYYTEIALPGVEEKLHLLMDRSSLAENESELVKGFFSDYKKEFLDHISQEEEHILPYILELESQSARERPDSAFIEKLRGYSIREFEKGHDRLETSLKHLSTLIIKYLPPLEDFQLCQQVLNDLAALVKDLVDHADMEDKILVPRVAELEKELLNSAHSG